MGAMATPRLSVAAAGSKQPVAIPPAAEILSHLNREHPRLLATARDFAQLKERVNSDPQLRQWHEDLREDGGRILKERPSKYEIPDGLRLLATSRRVVNRVYTLAMLYRLSGDNRYADRAWKELETAANFKDWNPRHFLDTAEMTHAFAIGYDWLYDVWTEAQRAVLHRAMVEKGIQLALDIQSKHTWWAKAHHNWNQVCNGGVGMGALALADVEPRLAGDYLNAALQSIQLAMVEYGPDGAWAEGPGYWNYATTYNVIFLAALQTALGSDFGLARIPGFSEAGSFPIYASGPTGLSFSYADCHAGHMGAPVLFWLAREFHRPEYAWFQSQRPNAHPLSLLWYDQRLVQKPAVPPLDKYYRNSEVTLMRSAWDDADALFAAFKSGDNKANHSHLDLGSFVLDALGTRWAEDIGADNYNLPGYFGKQRWDYYRLRAEGHNTLVINPGLAPDQDPRAASKIIKFVSQPDRAVAIADLTAAYAKNAERAQRGIAMLNRRQVLVQDEVQARAPSEVWWFLHTRAKAQVSADGRTATLSEGKARLMARILSPLQARFTVMKAEPLPSAPHPAKQGDNSKGRKLAIELQGVQDLRLAVLLTPLRDGETTSAHLPELSPLAAW
jgi:hypothetical protein